MGKLGNGFSTNGKFSLGDDEEADTNRVLKYSNELAKFLEKMLDNYDDHPGIYCTGKV